MENAEIVSMCFLLKLITANKTTHSVSLALRGSSVEYRACKDNLWAHLPRSSTSMEEEEEEEEEEEQKRRFSRQKKTLTKAKTTTRPTTNLSSLSDHPLLPRTSSFTSFPSSCSSASFSSTSSLTIHLTPVRFSFFTLSPSILIADSF